MIDAAHASRLFWENVGEPVHHVRGEWQISRAYAAAGRSDEALHHAERCLALCQDSAVGAFDRAYAYEGLARAHAVARDADAVSRYSEMARAEAEQIAEAQDRALLLSDLETLTS
jgi:hypothetical protein